MRTHRCSRPSNHRNGLKHLHNEIFQPSAPKAFETIMKMPSAKQGSRTEDHLQAINNPEPRAARTSPTTSIDELTRLNRASAPFGTMNATDAKHRSIKISDVLRHISSRSKMDKDRLWRRSGRSGLSGFLCDPKRKDQEGLRSPLPSCGRSKTCTNLFLKTNGGSSLELAPIRPGTIFSKTRQNGRGIISKRHSTQSWSSCNWPASKNKEKAP